MWVLTLKKHQKGNKLALQVKFHLKLDHIGRGLTAKITTANWWSCNSNQKAKWWSTWCEQTLWSNYEDRRLWWGDACNSFRLSSWKREASKGYHFMAKNDKLRRVWLEGFLRKNAWILLWSFVGYMPMILMSLGIDLTVGYFKNLV